MCWAQDMNSGRAVFLKPPQISSSTMRVKSWTWCSFNTLIRINNLVHYTFNRKRKQCDEQHLREQQLLSFVSLRHCQLLPSQPRPHCFSFGNQIIIFHPTTAWGTRITWSYQRILQYRNRGMTMGSSQWFISTTAATIHNMHKARKGNLPPRAGVRICGS